MRTKTKLKTKVTEMPIWKHIVWLQNIIIAVSKLLIFLSSRCLTPNNDQSWWDVVLWTSCARHKCHDAVRFLPGGMRAFAARLVGRGEPPRGPVGLWTARGLPAFSGRNHINSLTSSFFLKKTHSYHELRFPWVMEGGAGAGGTVKKATSVR